MIIENAKKCYGILGGIKMTFHKLNTQQTENNVNDIIQDLYKMTQATIIDKETGEPITVEDLQDLFYQDIEQLAYVLGIELEG